jgi:4-hydroxy-tetrahydrodipicolinate reductase
MGRALVPAILDAEDLELVSAVSRRLAGRPLGDERSRVRVSSTVAEALRARADVLVDYTSPEVVKSNVLAAIEAGTHVVIGTSGLDDSEMAEIDSFAREKRVGVVAGGNFSVTAALLLKFAVAAARYVDHWEILEYAHPDKVDAPSGTARELAHRLSLVRPPRLERRIEDTHGSSEARGATLAGSQVHSIRLPSFATSVEVLFGRPGVRLTLRHDSESGAAPYVAGTLLAARKVPSLVGLTRGFDHFLGE